MTQTELASRLGVSRSTVAMWETGANAPNADKLPFIAEILECKSIDELYDGFSYQKSEGDRNQ